MIGRNFGMWHKQTFDDEGAVGVGGSKFVDGVARIDASVSESHFPEWTQKEKNKQFKKKRTTK